MARIRITEYAAKKLVLGDNYAGITLTPDTLTTAVSPLSDTSQYVLKIDTGIKKRGLAGLVKVNLAKADITPAAQAFFALGHNRCIVEVMQPYDDSDEQYLSIDIGRTGATILHSRSGGVAIEEHADTIAKYLILHTTTPTEEVLAEMPGVNLSEILTTMATYHISFLEINPFMVKGDTFTALDMAAECDSAKTNLLPDWCNDHIITSTLTSPEQEVAEQNDRSQASLNLKVLNQNGSILTLLSGGGASLVTIDALVTAGLQSEIINYSEYSGAPTRDETYAYVKTLLGVLFASSAKKKVILIAGGVSNFTDIKETFLGIIDACSEVIAELQAAGVTVCVRRGGLNQDAGLAFLREFFTANHIPAEIHGPDLPLSAIGDIVKHNLV
jgi:succinyl-CoA synthetase beta subunit